MDFKTSPFHRFQGWHILVLLAVTFLYSYWYTVLGPYSKVGALGPGLPLEERGFYSGADAVAALSQLDPSGAKAKYISLIFDIPYMILLALTFEALIAFGIRRLNLTHVRWNFLFILPIAFLLCDFAEDSFIALTLASGSEMLGSIAGVMTALKFFTVMPAMLVGIVMGFTGLIVWIVQKLKSA